MPIPNNAGIYPPIMGIFCGCPLGLGPIAIPISIVPSMPDDEKDIPKDGELHIDGSSHVVPYANVYSLGSTTHNHELNNDMVRVPVTKVIGAKAQKPTFAEASAGSCLRETDSESGRRFGDEWTFEELDTPPCFGEFMTEAHFFS